MGTLAPRRPIHARRRAAVLVLVHALIAAHVTHYLVTGRTLAPLELNEALYTLHLGVVTAGFVFLGLAVLSVVVVGRFFCSWGCHLLALQDLCAWLMKKARVRPRPLRSRTLALVPVGAMLYLFAWPHVERALDGRPTPALRVVESGDGWASFVTDDFFRNLPGPGVSLLTLFVCGALVVYLLGSRAFCAYGCPWGALFGLADRIAPGRVVLRGDCTACGRCTAACGSGLDVMAEVRRDGAVLGPACLKDLDCVDACPTGALRFGLVRPAALRRGSRGPARDFDFTRGEDALMAAAFVVSLLAYRGLYDAVPFLLAVGLAACVAYAAVIGLRLARRRGVRVRTLVLARNGRLTAHGAAATILLCGLTALTAHSAWVRWHEHHGLRAYELAGESPAARRDAVEHLSAAYDGGLLHPTATARRLASLHLGGERPERAERYLRAVTRAAPDDLDSGRELGMLLVRSGRDAAGARELRRVARSAEAWTDAGVAFGRAGLDDDALDAFARALAIDAGHAPAHANLGVLLAARGQRAAAATHLRRALELDPTDRHARYALGLLDEGGVDP